MLKKFWESNSPLIQMTGIVTAIGTLFLAIHPSENISAQQSLLNIQFIWLLVMSMLLLNISFHLVRFIIRAERDLTQQYRFNFDFILAGLTAVLIYWVFVELWSYSIHLYRQSLVDFLHRITPVVFLLVLSLYAYGEYVIRTYITAIRWYGLALAGETIILSFAYSGYLQVRSLTFDVLPWLADSMVIMAIFCGIVIVLFARRLYVYIRKQGGSSQ
ncbi:MAG: hypothetical protein ACOYUK_02740 [Patescibacteria group bacterium]